MTRRSISSYEPAARSLLRIIAGALFACHGLQKVFGMFGGMGGRGMRAQLFTLMGAAGWIELVGGALLMLGLFTRPVAFLLCGQMAVAYFRSHAPRGTLPIQNGGELAVLYCFLFLYFVTTGAGPISLDRVLRRR